MFRGGGTWRARGWGGVVPRPPPPRAAAHLAILDVLLRPPASRIERDGHRLAAVWAGHVGLGLEGRRILLFALFKGVGVVVPHGIVIRRRHGAWQSSGRSSTRDPRRATGNRAKLTTRTSPPTPPPGLAHAPSLPG